MLTTEPGTEVDSLTTDDVECKIASTREERAAAFRLVYEAYLRAGLGEPNPYRARVTPYHLLPTTEVFVATCRGDVIFTLSLIGDGELGLPMESVYGAEVAARRAQGLYLGEVSCLADRRSQMRGFFPVFLRLSRMVVQYARQQGMDELLVAVHPKHARFYQRAMAFVPIGQQKAYPSVRNHPAVALELDFARIDLERPANYDAFFGQPLPSELLQSHPIPADQREYFLPMIDYRFVLSELGSTDCFSRSAETTSETGVA